MNNKIDKNKFLTSKPLNLSENVPSDKYYLYYYGFEEPKEFDISKRFIEVKRIEEKNLNLVFGSEVSEDKLLKYDILDCLGTTAPIVHKRIKEKLEELCPKDFQAFSIIIKNYKAKDEAFINRDYYILNILNLVDAIDEEKSIFYVYKDGMRSPDKRVYRENCMDGHLIARDRIFAPDILVDPKLAWELRKCKGIYFYTDKELSSFWGYN